MDLAELRTFTRRLAGESSLGGHRLFQDPDIDTLLNAAQKRLWQRAKQANTGWGVATETIDIAANVGKYDLEVAFDNRMLKVLLANQGVDFSVNGVLPGNHTTLTPAPPFGKELDAADVGTFQGVHFYTLLKRPSVSNTPLPWQISLIQRPTYTQSGGLRCIYDALPVDMVEEASSLIVLGGDNTANLADPAPATGLSSFDANFVGNGVLAGFTVANVTDGSSALITDPIGNEEIGHEALAGGANDDWEVGDVFTITAFDGWVTRAVPDIFESYHELLCYMSAKNLKGEGDYVWPGELEEERQALLNAWDEDVLQMARQIYVFPPAAGLRRSRAASPTGRIRHGRGRGSDVY